MIDRYLYNLITVELRYVQINILSSARIVQLAKPKAIAHFFYPCETLSGSHFSHTTQKLGNQNVPHYKTKNSVELKCYKTPSSYRVYNLMKLKPQMEANFKILE